MSYKYNIHNDHCGSHLSVTKINYDFLRQPPWGLWLWVWCTPYLRPWLSLSSVKKGMRFEYLMTDRNNDQSGCTSLSFVNEPKEKPADDSKYLWNVHPTRCRKSHLVRVPIILCLDCDFIYALQSELYELYTQEVPQKHMQRSKIGPEKSYLKRNQLIFSTSQKPARGSLINGHPLCPQCDNLVRRYSYHTTCIVEYTQYIPYIVYVLVLWSCWRC
jgi:hypothetical protein